MISLKNIYPGSSTAAPPPPAVSAYSETEVPPSQLAARLRVWEETGRAVVVHSPQGRHLAVSGGRNIIQVQSSVDLEIHSQPNTRNYTCEKVDNPLHLPTTIVTSSIDGRMTAVLLTV